jgi:glutaminyl-peptide cyclotransferase
MVLGRLLPVRPWVWMGEWEKTRAQANVARNERCRSLAAEWEASRYPAFAKFPNPLNQITLFALFDLLGSASPTIPSYFQDTHWAYKNMATIESRMRKLGLLESQPRTPFLPDSGKMSAQFYPDPISDDHLPFMHAGAPIMHVIPNRFPDVWHELTDDGEHLDMPTVQDWSRIVTAFALEWLEMMEVEPQDATTTTTTTTTTG